MSRTILVVDDEKTIRWSLGEALTEGGYDVVEAETAEKGFELFRDRSPDLVLLDLRLPGEDGISLLKRIKLVDPTVPVIMMTAYGEVGAAVEAMKSGAYDFVQKPFALEKMKISIENGLEVHRLKNEIAYLKEKTSSQIGFRNFIGQSEPMTQIFAKIQKIGKSKANTILITGESGVGKELVARTIHACSHHEPSAFMEINCASVPETLLESELFGYEKGAFTGAVKQTPGKFETAHRGTLFLDEIGDLPLGLQAKLLRFLQERLIERVGGREGIPVDVRIVCATHQNLRDLISAGRFREDLYFRLAEIVLEVPPLRKRPGDASLLAHAFVRRHAEEQRRGTMTLAPEAIAAIEAHPWPGNVRELENCIKRAVIMADTSVIRASDVGLAPAPQSDVLNLRQVRDDAEKQAVIRVLGRANGNLSRAAELLGISRPTLYDLLDRFGLR
jgi:two-component system NtrC family response regulator